MIIGIEIFKKVLNASVLNISSVIIDLYHPYVNINLHCYK